MLRKTSMKQERWQRLKEIVADALEEDSPAARTALVNRECADDLSLLREAESFLANADTVAAEGMDRLEECAAAASAAVRRDKILTPGRRVGAYVIIRDACICCDSHVDAALHARSVASRAIASASVGSMRTLITCFMPAR